MSRLARFIAACGLTNLGDGIAMVAWTWVASLLTRDPLWIALVPATLKLPWVLFVLPAGVITDRHDRRRLILGADLLRVVAYALAALAVTSALPLPAAPLRGLAEPGLFAALMACAFGIGVAEVVRDTAAQTMMPALVPSAGLERANGRLWAVEMTANALLGPALAGVLLGLSPALPFGANALAMAAAVLILLRLPGDFRPEGAVSHRNWRAELAEGWRLLMGSPVLKNLAVLTGLWNLGFEAMMVALVLVVQERLGLGPWAMSVILGSGAAGGVLAGFVSGAVVGRIGPGRAMQLSMVAAAVFPLVLFSNSLWLIALGFFLSEFFGILWNTISVSYRQRIVPSRLLGRLNATYRLFALGMVPLGMLLSGLSVRAAETVAAREVALLAPFALAFILYAVMTAVWFGWLGRAFTR